MSTVQSIKVLDKIRSRGHWSVVIRPTVFDASRVSYADLFSIVERNSVRFRGWDYPHIDYETQPLRGDDWVGQEFDRDDVIEVWRIHTSGLFAHYFAMTGEWRNQSDYWPPEPGWKPGKFVYYRDLIYSFVEVFEFAARLAQSKAGGSQMLVEIAINGLQGREISDPDGKYFLDPSIYRTSSSEWKRRREYSQSELIADPRHLAAEQTQDFFERFGLPLSLEVLAQIQAGLAR